MILKFLLIFNLLAVPLYAIIYTNYSFFPLQSFTADVVNSILKTLGHSTSLTDNMIVVAQNNLLLRIDVSWDSTGWKSLYALTALAIATPVAAKKKIKFVAIALPIIFILNIARIVTTITVSLSYGLENLELIHNFLWREGLIAAVLGFWAVWAIKQKYNIDKK